MPDYFYEVALDYRGVAVDARVNDGSLWLKRSRADGNFEIVANRWIHAGKNTFTYRLYPYPGERGFHTDFYARVSIYERQRGAPRESRHEVASARYTAGDATALGRTSDGGLLSSINFNANVAFPQWIWASAPSIPDSSATFVSLLSELDAIHNLLARRDVTALAKRVRERDREIAIAHYELVDSQFTETLRDFEAMVSKSNLPLEPRETKNLTLRLYGDQRLARIEDENGDSPIYFLSRDETIVRFVPFIFCLKRDHSWLVIR